MKTLNKNDIKLLRDALASNGGGVNSELYAEAVKARLMKARLIQWKPNQKVMFTVLITITPAGKQVLKELP